MNTIKLPSSRADMIFARKLVETSQSAIGANMSLRCYKRLRHRVLACSLQASAYLCNQASGEGQVILTYEKE